MRILIIRKTTNLELHGDRVRLRLAVGNSIENDLRVLQAAHDEHYQTLRKLNELVKTMGIEYDELQRGMPWPIQPNSYDAVITVGGDGTLLSASHSMPFGGLLIGVRSSETSVGFLCCATEKTLESMLVSLMDRTIKTANVERLLAEIKHADSGVTHRTMPVLNDFLFSAHNPAVTTRYRIKLGGDSEEHKSSGIWISTAIGSTGAISAAGGNTYPIEERRFQYSVRELYRIVGQTLSLTNGLFDPDQQPLSVFNKTERAILALDGQHGAIALGFGDQVIFKRAHPITIGRKA